MSDYNDTGLIRRLQAGEVVAFDCLYSKYHKPVYGYIIRYLKIAELAEDVLQEVFLKIWEVRHNIRPELSFQAYLYRIARNVVYRQLKKIAADEGLVSSVGHAVMSAVEDAGVRLQWHEYEKILQEAISQLPPQRQKIFKLCRQEGKSYEDVALELGISRNTVKEHMVLGTRFLKEFISSNYKIDLAIMLALLASNLDN